MKPLHWSQLRYMRSSPLDYQYHLAHPFSPTPAMKLSTLVHEFVFGEEGPYHTPWVVYDGPRRGKAWTDFKAENHDKVIYTADEKHRAFDIAKVVLDAWPEWAKGGETEKTLEFEINGRKCGGTPDAASRAVLADLKVTSYAHPKRIEGQIIRMGWHGQLAFYEEACKQSGFIPESVMIFAVDPAPPHNYTICLLSELTMDAGKALYERLLADLDDCEASGKWPSYNNGNSILIDIQDDEPLVLTIGGEEVEV